MRGREERGRGEERGEGGRGDGEGGGKSTHNIMSSKCISGGARPWSSHVFPSKYSHQTNPVYTMYKADTLRSYCSREPGSVLIPSVTDVTDDVTSDDVTSDDVTVGTVS